MRFFNGKTTFVGMPQLVINGIHTDLGHTEFWPNENPGLSILWQYTSPRNSQPTSLLSY